MPEHTIPPLDPDDEQLLRVAAERLVADVGATPPSTATSLARGARIARRRKTLRYSATIAIAAAIAAAIAVPLAIAGRTAGHLTPARPGATSPTHGQQPTPTSTAPTAPTPTAHTAYVYDSADGGTLVPIDLANDAAGTPIALSLSTGTVNDIAVTASGTTAYVAGTRQSPFANVIVPVDLTTGTVGDPIVLPVATSTVIKQIVLTPDGHRLYALTGGISTALIAVDLATHSTQAPIPLPTGGTGLAVTPDGRHAYVTDQEGVTPVDLRSGTVGSHILLGATGFSQVAVAPDGKTAYVVWWNSITNVSSLTPIDVATNTPGRSVRLPGVDDLLTLGPSGTTAYVGQLGSHGSHAALLPVDLAGHSVGTPIALPTADVSYLAVTPDGQRAYVSGFLNANGTSTGAVIPIDLKTDAVERPILMPSGYQAGPGGIVFSSSPPTPTSRPATPSTTTSLASTSAAVLSGHGVANVSFGESKSSTIAGLNPILGSPDKAPSI